MSFDSNIDDVIDDLDEMKDSVEEAAGDETVELSELFSDSFVSEHTDFESLEEMVEVAAEEHVVEKFNDAL